jgi:AraC-like DNA-binding protein
MSTSEITYFKSQDIGKGLPYGVTFFENIKPENDIFIPSLRDFHVVFFIFAGKGKYVVDFVEYDFEPNTLILLSKDQLHHFLPFSSQEVKIASITFNPEFLYRNESDLQHLFSFDSTQHNTGQQILSMPPFVEQKISRQLREMKEVYDKASPVFQSKAFYHWLCLMLIQIEMIQTGQSQTHEAEDESNRLALQFKQLLENHFTEEYKVDFYLNQLNTSSKTLAKATANTFKLSPKAMINERRLLEIKRRLMGTGDSVKSISYDLHFDEPTNLFKFFRKHVGKSPKEFRGES